MVEVVICRLTQSLGMNKADSDRIHELCSLIAVEQNRQRFLKLVEELNRILGNKGEQLHHNQPDDPEPK